MRIKCEKTVAVCVDYQEKLLPAVFDSEKLISDSVKLLNGLKTLGVTMYLTQQYTKGLGATIAPIREAAGTEEYLEKIRYSAYSLLEERLVSPEKTPYVIICGIESHVCVLQTAMELKEHGYQPYLVTNCIASRKREDYEAALARAKQEGILLTTYEAVLFELLEIAGTPESKVVQKIVR